jgi:hypothetical protein
VTTAQSVEQLEHYGKDLLTIQGQARIPLGHKLRLLGATSTYLRGILKTLGLGGTVRLVRGVKQEIAQAQTRDWTRLEAKGISRDHLQAIVNKIALAKVMAETMGLERASQLRRAFSAQISIPVFEEMFAPADVFLQCGKGDFLPPFKQYYGALMDAMAEKGLEQAEVVEDTEDVFQLNVTYCAWAEVAKEMGNPAYCYYSTCYGDEVFFPHLVAQAGFAFERQGTLALGAPACDFRFTRL